MLNSSNSKRSHISWWTVTATLRVRSNLSLTQLERMLTMRGPNDKMRSRDDLLANSERGSKMQNSLRCLKVPTLSKTELNCQSLDEKSNESSGPRAALTRDRSCWASNIQSRSTKSMLWRKQPGMLATLFSRCQVRAQIAQQQCLSHCHRLVQSTGLELTLLTVRVIICRRLINRLIWSQKKLSQLRLDSQVSQLSTKLMTRLLTMSTTSTLTCYSRTRMPLSNKFWGRSLLLAKYRLSWLLVQMAPLSPDTRRETLSRPL